MVSGQSHDDCIKDERWSGGTNFVKQMRLVELAVLWTFILCMNTFVECEAELQLQPWPRISFCY